MELKKLKKHFLKVWNKDESYFKYEVYLNKKEERFFELEGKEKTENSTFRLISQI